MMVQARLQKKPFDLNRWLTFVEAELGPLASQGYSDMKEGRLIIPPDSCLGKYCLKRVDQEQFELGFAERSLLVGGKEGHVVEELDLESRAAREGGVMEGDRITVKKAMLWNARQWDKNFTMTVLRGMPAEEIELTWWPRSYRKVESYQWVAAKTSGDHGQ